MNKNEDFALYISEALQDLKTMRNCLLQITETKHFEEITTPGERGSINAMIARNAENITGAEWSQKLHHKYNIELTK